MPAHRRSSVDEPVGGRAAAFAALRHPGAFGNVLAQSGGFGWRPAPEEEYEWLTRQFATSPVRPVRFSLEVGRLETAPIFGDGPSFVAATRHLRDVLQAKGYRVRYAEFGGGHDELCWRGTLADGLLALFGADHPGGGDTIEEAGAPGRAAI